MKKLLFLLLLITSVSYGQAIAPTRVKITNNAISTTAPFIATQETDGFVNKINKSDLIEVIEKDSAVNLPVTGVAGKIYVTLDNNRLYRWTGTIYQDLGYVDISNKVDKVNGKSLISDAEITRLATLANYTHPTNHPPSIITQDASNRFVTDAEKTAWNAKQSALGHTPEDIANKSSSFTASSTVTYANTKALVDGLAIKANDTDVVHKSGAETVTGAKTFIEPLLANAYRISGLTTGNTNALVSDGSNLYYGNPLTGSYFEGTSTYFTSQNTAFFYKTAGVAGTEPNHFIVKSQLDLKADLISPQFTGTASSGTTTAGNTPPTANNQLTRKDYVDTGLALKSSKYIYNVEDYRNNSISESIWLQSLIDLAPENATFVFKNNTIYTLNNSLTPKKGQVFNGNGATIKRDIESKTTLSSNALSTTTTLNLTSIPSNWKVGDYIHVFTGSKATETSREKIITNINGNVVTIGTALNGYATSTETPVTYPSGAQVRKVYALFSGVQFPLSAPFKIDNFIFDGNAVNNSSNYFWFFNTTILNFGFGGEVTNNRFKNIPNENIVCSGTKVLNNFAEDLNGSFVHLSSPPIALGENIQGTLVQGNTAFRTNKIDPTFTDHSYSVIENSWNPGKIIISNNYFEGMSNGAYCNNFIFPNTAPTNLSDEVLITGNVFKNYSQICQPLTDLLLTPYNQNSRLISDNIFINCGSNNFSLLSKTPIRFHNNLYSSGTQVLFNQQTIKERLSIEGLTVNQSDAPFSVQIGGLDQPKVILMGTAETKPAIQGYDKNTLTTDAPLHIQPYGGVVNIGSITGNGDKLYVNGSAFFESNIKTIPATLSNHVVVKSQLDAIRSYKVYTALLTQTGTNAPVATVLENTLGFTPTFSYSITGVFTVNSTNGFIDNKTYINFSIPNGVGTNWQGNYTRNNNSIIQLDSRNSGVLANGSGSYLQLEIRVYN